MNGELDTELDHEVVPYDDPAWGSTDRWELGPWLPAGAKLVPLASLAVPDGERHVQQRRRASPSRGPST